VSGPFDTTNRNLEIVMQVVTQQQFTPLPLKPGCLVWYAGDPCDELIQQYNQAVEQRQRQEWQFDVAAPLQRQIADQQKQIADQQNQIKTLQLTIESQTTDALQSEARNQAFLNGVGAVLGVGMAFFVAVAGFRRVLARSATAPKREPQGVASALRPWHESDREVINLRG
jgi:hypothetical protein